MALSIPINPQGYGDDCPSCGAAGRVMSRHVTAPTLASVGYADMEQEWACVCGCSWRTLEQYRNPASRRLLEIQAPLVGGYAFGGGVSAPSPWRTPPLSFGPSHLSRVPPAPSAPEVEREPEKSIAGSVIGYRAWRIVDWKLLGTGVNREWTPGVNTATCDAGDAMSNAHFGLRHARAHPAPSIGCACGITALARFKPKDDHWQQADVFGAIEAWSDETDEDDGGRFILHGTGFRAQYGKIVLLAVDDGWPAAKQAAVRALAREHEADVCKHAHLEDAAKEHGQLVPDEMLDWAKDAPASSLDGLQQAILAGSVNMRSLSQAMQALAISPPKAPKGKRGPKPPKRTPGICQTLGYTGPPSNGKFRTGQRVRDRAGTIWQCVKRGEPGSWEIEAA